MAMALATRAHVLEEGSIVMDALDEDLFRPPEVRKAYLCLEDAAASD